MKKLGKRALSDEQSVALFSQCSCSCGSCTCNCGCYCPGGDNPSNSGYANTVYISTAYTGIYNGTYNYDYKGSGVA